MSHHDGYSAHDNGNTAQNAQLHAPETDLEPAGGITDATDAAGESPIKLQAQPQIDWAEQPPQAGTLYVIATPIGNLGDLTFRAASLLRLVDWIACEDTRTSGRLLERIGSKRPTLSYHEHNELARTQELLGRLGNGEHGALICDAGTPTISDPGFRLVRACRKAGVAVVAVPGANAAVASLSVSGLPTNAFAYHGFLAPKSAARQRFLREQAQAAHTLVLYESSHRIAKLADDIVSELGAQRCVCIARELTKRHETVLCGPIGEVRGKLTGANLKGEFVVCIAPEGYVL